MIISGNNKPLWDAVKTAKNMNVPPRPAKMTLNNTIIESDNLPDTFAMYFNKKIFNIVNAQVIEDSVHNGIRKLWTTDHHFMSLNNILKAIKTLKKKNCEGHDRKPQTNLIDGIEILKYPLSYLFKQIYSERKIPE